MTTPISAAQAMLDHHAEKIAVVHARTEQTIHRINNHRGLSEQARQGGIARAYREAQVELEQLRESGKKALDAYGQRLIDRAVGFRGGDSQTVTAQREARRVAASINDPGIAMEMMRTAQQDGDTQMAKAIAGRAFSNSWHDVLNQWNHDGSNDPAMRLLNEHQELPHIKPEIWNAHHFLAPPRELDGMKDYEITRAANTDYSDGGEAA
ncbi:hypothetical protein [Streptomyces chartreusis]|uniref:Uncharacterized protein n=1 Tax=Streptomyces chartreusis TaxID=1969 RepID=A0A7H8TJ33_STRCX|nr:hypothetical protein [Streptomyces chartreusis]QKZ22070.1 hypothetical protein HUT05_34810 [Streptomyces chartreusis]